MHCKAYSVIFSLICNELTRQGGYLKFCILLSLLFLLQSILPSVKVQAAVVPQISFIVPEGESDGFWSLVSEVTQTAAKSLKLQLNVVHSHNNRFANIRSISTELAKHNKPNFIIFRPYEGNLDAIFQLLESHKVYSVTIEKDLDRQAYIDPRTGKKYQYWLGQISYDEVQGGELLVNSLIQIHRQKAANRPANITAFGGAFDETSKKREQALYQLITAPPPEIHLNRIIPTHWSSKFIKSNFRQISARYPDTNIFWCASDDLALSVLEYRSILNPTTTVGGVDWQPKALEKIKTGELDVSVGGHFLMGAKAVVNIFDFSWGINNFNEPQTLQHFEAITRENVDNAFDFVTQKRWIDIDFHQFTETHTNQPVELTLEAMIELLNHRHLSNNS